MFFSVFRGFELHYHRASLIDKSAIRYRRRGTSLTPASTAPLSLATAAPLRLSKTVNNVLHFALQLNQLCFNISFELMVAIYYILITCMKFGMFHCFDFDYFRQFYEIACHIFKSISYAEPYNPEWSASVSGLL